jgi:hypothetical protein
MSDSSCAPQRKRYTIFIVYESPFPIRSDRTYYSLPLAQEKNFRKKMTSLFNFKLLLSPLLSLRFLQELQAQFLNRVCVHIHTYIHTHINICICVCQVFPTERSVTRQECARGTSHDLPLVGPGPHASFFSHASLAFVCLFAASESAE